MLRYRNVALATVAILVVVFGHPALTARGVEVAPTDGALSSPPDFSHRLIVELESPPVAEWASGGSGASVTSSGTPAFPSDARGADGKLNLNHPQVATYVSRLAAEQQTFESRLTREVPGASVARFINELGGSEALRYRIVFNGMAIDSGLPVGASRSQLEAAAAKVSEIEGVKRVYLDAAHDPAMYLSLDLINAPAVWDAVGGRGEGGSGVKAASMDGGVHKDHPMFSGEGYTYPPGYPIGYTSNTNGKIIVSRAYFRDWDPPKPTDDTPWPGAFGTSHGVHTAGTVAGNTVDASYFGVSLTLSGVAPDAYVMSYRVFYDSVNDIGSFYNAEGIAALEDVVRDDADTLNNSWGGGPTSFGGDFDALDTALVNAWNAGVFVSMSAGNAGPGLGTGDHPSEDYINAAASTTGGNYASGFLNVTAPEPVSDSLKMMEIGTASFGAPLEEGVVLGPFEYNAGVNIDPANYQGCNEWDGSVFDGVVAVVSRGVCAFSIKAYYAQQAGATMIVIHNNVSDAPQGMSGSDFAEEVTIPVISVGQSDGVALGNWETMHGDAARFEVSTVAVQIGNTPDEIINFSSRGPAVGNRLKPDIAAPGVNIISAGYASATGEGRHLGYGQVSGTSMASPHVAGTATLLRQVHPEWSNAQIKSAIMTTSKYMEIYNQDGTPAQPLDMGAGRLDLTNITDPGFTAMPPSLSFGQVVTGSAPSISVELTSVSDAEETYELSTIYTGDSFTETTEVPGITIEPGSVTLAPGGTATFEVTWESTEGFGLGDNQGYLLLDGDAHQGHLPMWMRVVPPEKKAVLLLDNDGSGFPEDLGAPAFTDYSGVYTETLEELGYSPCDDGGSMDSCYDVYDADAESGSSTTVPEAWWLSQYETIVWQTGDNYIDAAVTPITALDEDRLVEYINQGGKIIAFGQDLSSVLGATADGGPLLFEYGFGANSVIQDSVTGGVVMSRTLQLGTGVPESGFAGINVDLGGTGDGAANQAFVDELEVAESGEALMRAGSTAFAQREGFIATGARDQPSLERLGVSSMVDNLYFAFGLEGVNNELESVVPHWPYRIYLPNAKMRDASRGSDTTPEPLGGVSINAGAGSFGLTTRSELLGHAFDWLWDDATLVITPTIQGSGMVTFFEANMDSTRGGPAEGYRWNFGDGSPIVGPVDTDSMIVGHRYWEPGTYTVWAEATNRLGTRVVTSMEVEIPEGTEYVTPAPPGPTPAGSVRSR